MAVDTIILSRPYIFACKVETTTGTAEALTASEGGFNAMSPEITDTTPFEMREAEGSGSAMIGNPGEYSGSYTLELKVAGSGSAATLPTWANLFKGCGMAIGSSANALTFSTGSLTTLTLGRYRGGSIKEVLAGAAGDFTITGSGGKPVSAKFNFSGIYQAPASATIIAPTYSTQKPPRFVSASLSIGGSSSYQVANFELTAGNTVYLREDVNAASGIRSAVVTSRSPKITLDPEAVGLSTKDWSDVFRTRTTVAFTCSIGGGTTGASMTITAPAMQLVAPPTYGDRSGVLTNALTFGLNRSADAGDDELLIQFP